MQANHGQSPDLPDRLTDLHSQHLLITTPQVNVPWPTMQAGTAGKEDTTFNL